MTPPGTTMSSSSAAKTSAEITPYHTESGVHAAAALIARARGDLAAESTALQAFIAASSRDCAEVDLTLGKSATLISGSLLLDLGGARPEIEALKTLGNARLDEISRELDQRPPIANPPNTLLGMAHGWCGYAYAALRWCAASGAPLPAAIPRRLDELAALRVRRGRASCWQRQVGGHPHDILPGWCNGAADSSISGPLPTTRSATSAISTLPKKRLHTPGKSRPTRPISAAARPDARPRSSISIAILEMPRP